MVPADGYLPRRSAISDRIRIFGPRRRISGVRPLVADAILRAKATLAAFASLSSSSSPAFWLLFSFDKYGRSRLRSLTSPSLTSPNAEKSSLFDVLVRIEELFVVAAMMMIILQCSDYNAVVVLDFCLLFGSFGCCCM